MANALSDEVEHIPTALEILPDKIDEIPEWDKEFVAAELNAKVATPCREDFLRILPIAFPDRSDSERDLMYEAMTQGKWYRVLNAAGVYSLLGLLKNMDDEESHRNGFSAALAYKHFDTIIKKVADDCGKAMRDSVARKFATDKIAEGRAQSSKPSEPKYKEQPVEETRSSESDPDRAYKEVHGATKNLVNIVKGGAALAPTKTPVVVSNISFHEVNKFSGDTMTNLQKEELWKNYKGKCVEWTGELTHLDSNFFNGFTVRFKHLPDTRSWDVMIDNVPESMKEKLLTWTKGKRYTYRARLRDYAGIGGRRGFQF